MMKTATVALVAGLVVTGAHAQTRTPAQETREAVDGYFEGNYFRRGYVLGYVRAIRNSIRQGAWNICIPGNPTDGYVADVTMARLRDHVRRGTETGTRWTPDLAMISAMAEVYPCRN